MKKLLSTCFAILVSFSLFAQGLTVDKIMQDPIKWIGTAPSNIFWSEDSKTIYFSWNPDKKKGDSLYKIVLPSHNIEKVSPTERRKLPSQSGTYSKNYSMKVYEKSQINFVLAPFL